MKPAFEEYNQIVASIPDYIQQEVDMQMVVSNRIYELRIAHRFITTQ